MTPARFGLQAAIVLALIALVSWPEHRQLAAGAFWQSRGPLTARKGQDNAASRSGRRRYLIGYGSASEAALGVGGASSLHRKLYENDVEGRRRRRTPADVLARGGKLNGIFGYALSATNGPVPFARVVLRNLATGLVEARGAANEHGEFTFLDVMPGKGYIVELLDENGSVVATSEVIEIELNDLRDTTVRMSGRQSALFGGAIGPSAQQAVAAAANNGVNRVAAPDRCASPPCSATP
jgi:hypothetical protein